jgi:DNA (cytosine-5)-methyltransferase 1
MKPKIIKIEAIDLYCGAGGLTFGLQQAKIKVVAGIDLDGTCKFAFEKNNNSTFIEKDVKEITGDLLAKKFTSGSIKLLAGCAPCQPFSTYTNGADATKHAKWGLLQEFERLVLELEPDIVTMENVPQLADHTPFEDFVSTLRDMDYKVDWRVVNCADYGVPQHRKRLVLVASKLGDIKVPQATHKGVWISTKKAIGKLAAIGAGEQLVSDPLHRASTLSPVNIKRIKASKPGGTWEDWPRELIAKCHTVEKGKTFRSVYGRMKWDAPAPTMTTLCFGFGNGRFGHPEQDRAISLREASILQSFPPDYQFTEAEKDINFKGVGRMIGNAVPPALGAAIGAAIASHVASNAK